MTHSKKEGISNGIQGGIARRIAVSHSKKEGISNEMQVTVEPNNDVRLYYWWSTLPASVIAPKEATSQRILHVYYHHDS